MFNRRIELFFILTVDWCPDPPQGEGATVELSGKRAGSTATYSCKPGFILFGQKVCNLFFLCFNCFFIK